MLKATGFEPVEILFIKNPVIFSFSYINPFYFPNPSLFFSSDLVPSLIFSLFSHSLISSLVPSLPLLFPLFRSLLSYRRSFHPAAVLSSIILLHLTVVHSTSSPPFFLFSLLRRGEGSISSPAPHLCSGGGSLFTKVDEHGEHVVLESAKVMMVTVVAIHLSISSRVLCFRSWLL
ncbi:uncharacterized protein LOC110720828 [Chenopodium quinoa]|uniref:uncharacterized protein LOC110720828 n=1 Tax=Chenopodium quinoa TaxID=63459 RepID=UPI000B770B98|nr:uncharacterized protein LOC110720828 [Chenopodium quinoa]